MDNFVKELNQRFPLMYGDSFDVYVGPGWQRIVTVLSIAIQEHINRRKSHIEYFTTHEKEKQFGDIPEPIEQVKVTQVKEKFGGLRFYYDGGDDYIDGMVEMAEHWADNTCEECGKPGHVRYDLSWHKTLCEEHYEQRKNRT